MKILVTGIAGFIGSAVGSRLLNEGHHVWGIDNLNPYYDVGLKIARLRNLGIDIVPEEGSQTSTRSGKLTFSRINLEDDEALSTMFSSGQFDVVVHLAAQPGARDSSAHPKAYIRSNIDAFANVLEACREHHTGHLIFASSSSVYGLNGKVPFSESDPTAHPMSLYAATKKSNELMAHAYSQLYGLPVTGLRFFTVYGPWGRPDMSPFLFIDAISRGETIKVFNGGDMLRDFTYIDDIAESVFRVVTKLPDPDPGWDANHPDPASSTSPYRIYNIGNQKPVRLIDYIACIEKELGREAKKEMMPMQPGDVYQTYADTSALTAAIGFTPSTPLREGLRKTIDWYKTYHTHE